MKYNVTINGTDVTEFVAIPISEQFARDESLDASFLKLSCCDFQEPITPMSNVNITITDDFGNEKKSYFIVSSDNVTEVISLGKFNHELLLVEETKILERYVGSAKTTTNPLYRDYIYEQTTVKPNILVNDAGQTFRSVSYFKSPMFVGDTIKFPSIRDVILDPTPLVIVIFDTTIVKDGEVIYTNNKYISENFTTIAEEGTYTAYYADATAGNVLQSRASFTLQVVNKVEVEQPKPKTIRECIEDVLYTIDTIYDNEQPRFTLNEEQALQYESIEAPEFSLSGTLFEMLQTIGQYIHAIPRLRNNVIYFEELGKETITDVDLEDYISCTKKFDIEQYATEIDTTVDNIMNVLDNNDGSTIEPFWNVYKTPRTESGTVQITEDNMIFKVSNGIGKIISFECGYLSNGTLVGDITPWLYEDAEYQTLSTTQDTYPLSIGYALKYTIGDNKITNFTTKLPDAFDPVFKDFAIKNIICKKLGLEKGSLEGENVLKLQFRLTYIPLVSARLKQSKPYAKDLTYPSTLTYNQGTNSINANSYGENLKGVIARLGNPEISKTYIMNDLSMIPNIGDKFDKDYYITTIKCEYYKDLFKCELGLSKDFNRLNEYVGIKNEVRFWEISEKQSYDRYVVLRDYCVLGLSNTVPEGDTNALITNGGLTKMVLYMKNKTPEETQVKVNVAKITGYDNNENKIKSVFLPVVSFALGNSIVFAFKFDDNYSAGEKVTQSGLTVVQNQVRYTDLLGEVEKISIQMGTIAELYDEFSKNYESSVNIGNSIPDIENTVYAIPYTWFDTGNNKVVLKKDNRERILFSYQIDFVADDDNIVIGSGLSRYNAFTKNGTCEYKIVTLNRRIGKFEKNIDISNYIQSIDEFTSLPLVLGKEFGIGFQDVVATGDAKSIVIVNNNELVLAINRDIKEGELVLPELITFTMKRKIEKENEL